ncbi:hypothetical protein NC652_024233 [Populus alba x Populus x berolinensis]|nr:hypothetical protein NC652_024233 [Populus alba x Populus x berolinensis]
MLSITLENGKNKSFECVECFHAVHLSLLQGSMLRRLISVWETQKLTQTNPVLKEEQNAQVGKVSRGDVTILAHRLLSTIVNIEFHDRGILLMQMWRPMSAWTIMGVAGKIKQPTSQPAGTHFVGEYVSALLSMVCSSKEMVTATVKWSGWGSMVSNSCSSHPLQITQMSGSGRCKINNGGCWHESRDGHTFSACLDVDGGKCQCPPGFKGDGVKSCVGKIFLHYLPLYCAFIRMENLIHFERKFNDNACKLSLLRMLWCLRCKSQTEQHVNFS